MSTTKYLEENYSSHPAFSFPEKPYRIDLAKIASFDTNYKLAVNGGLEEDALFEVAKIKLAAQVSEIFGEMRLQTNDKYERMFLDELESQLPGISSKIHYVDAPLLEIASREIRSRIARGHSVRYYLPTTVYEYINDHHLYQQLALGGISAAENGSLSR